MAPGPSSSPKEDAHLLVDEDHVEIPTVIIPEVSSSSPHSPSESKRVPTTTAGTSMINNDDLRASSESANPRVVVSITTSPISTAKATSNQSFPYIPILKEAVADDSSVGKQPPTDAADGVKWALVTQVTSHPMSSTPSAKAHTGDDSFSVIPSLEDSLQPAADDSSAPSGSGSGSGTDCVL